MPVTNDIYGQIITPYDVEQAVIAHLKNWLPTYLAEIERQAGLAPEAISVPPEPDKSFRGGIDFDTWEVAWLPCLIVVLQPIGEPEREYSNRTYAQTFEIQVASIIQGDDEDTARQQAQWYGAAVMGVLTQHGSLGTFAQTGTQVALDTVMMGYPQTDFPDPDPNARRIVRSVVTIHSLIDHVITGAIGPLQPATIPYEIPGGRPTVTTINTTISAQPLS